MSFKDIGLKLQIAREEKRMSQEQLARAVGCSQSALSNYEKGKRRLYLSQLENLAEILDKPLEYFVESMQPQNAEDQTSENSARRHTLIHAIEKLNDQQLEKVMDYIDYLQWNKEGSR